jgi:uncharacterized protein involved in exopolysaccharide biosynthesis
VNQFQHLDLIKSLSLDDSRQVSKVSAKSLVVVLFRQWKVFSIIFSTVLLLGAIYIFGSHKKYVSEMKLLVQNSRSAEVISAGRVEAPAFVSEVSEEQLNSELVVLQSADVLNEVVEPGWGQIPSFRRPRAVLMQHEGAVAALRKNLVVFPIRKSHLISVQLTPRDPNESILTLRKLLMAYLDKKREIGRPEGASQFFVQEADRYRRQWQEAQQRLSAYQQGSNLVSINDQERELQRQLFDLDTQLRNTEVEMKEVQHKIQGDSAQLNAVPNRRSTRETAIPAVGSIDQMHTQLSTLELRRTELLTKYKADDRLVKQVEQQIGQIKAALQDSHSLYSAETSSDINPTWQLTEQDLSFNQAKLEGVRARRLALTAQLNDLRSKLAATEGQTSKFTSLQHKVNELEANYQIYTQKRDESLMRDAMDQHQLLNVAVAEEPTYSITPARPQPLTDGVLTILTAIFIACFAVYVVDNGRSTFSNARELEAVTRHPVLATVPSISFMEGPFSAEKREFRPSTPSSNMFDSASGRQ